MMGSVRRILDRLLPARALAWNRNTELGGFTEDLHLCADPRYYRMFCSMLSAFPIVRAQRGAPVFPKGEW